MMISHSIFFFYHIREHNPVYMFLYILVGWHFHLLCEFVEEESVKIIIFKENDVLKLFITNFRNEFLTCM